MQSLQGRSLPYRSRGREQHLFARVFQRGGKFTLLSNTVKPLNQEDFSNLHQAIKNIFSRKENPNVSLPGRWKHFLSNWQRITTNPVILGYVGSYKIPIGEALQDLTPAPVKMIEKQRLIVEKEVEEMLKRKRLFKFRVASKLSICCSKEINRVSAQNKFKEIKILGRV